MNENKKFNITEELMGITALNQFSMYVSSARLAMYTSYLSQYVSIISAEERQILAGLDLDLGESSFSISAPCNLTVAAVVSKFKDKNKKGTKVIIYRSSEGVLGHIIIPCYHSSHDEHGFLYKENISLYAGLNIKEGEVIASSPSRVEGGGFKTGVHLRTIYTTEVRSAEDGYVIRKGALEKFAYHEIRTVTIDIKQGDIPLSIYPNGKTYPGIGEKVLPNGMVMAIRPETTNPSLLSKRALGIIDPWDDNPKYTEAGGGTVVDISITKGLSRNIGLSGISDSLLREDTMYNEFAKTVVGIYDNEVKRTVGDLPITHKLNSFLSELEIVMATHATDKKRPTPHIKKQPIKGYRITFKIALKVIPYRGAKMSDPYGGKGVVTYIMEDDDAPVDADGNIIDVVINPGSTIGRMNLGRLNEQEFWSVREGCLRQMMAAIGLKLNEASEDDIDTAIESASDDDLDNCWSRLMTLYKISSIDSYEFFMDVSCEEKLDWISECMKKRISMKFDISDAIKYTEISDELIREFKPLRGKLRDKNEVYPESYSGMIYYSLLEPTPSEWSGVSSGPTQIHGVLHSPSKDKKAGKPYPYNSGKHISETEAAIIAFSAGSEAIATIMDRNTSILTHYEIYQNILIADKPLAMKSLSSNKLGTSMSIDILKSHTRSLGYTFTLKGR